MLLTLFLVLFHRAVLSSEITGDSIDEPTWEVMTYAIPGVCFNTTTYSTDTSFIYQCTNDSLWLFEYSDDDQCGGIASSTSRQAGCEEGTQRFYTQVSGCAAAKNVATPANNCKYYITGTDTVAPIDVCINSVSGSVEDYMWVCTDNNMGLRKQTFESTTGECTDPYNYTDYETNTTERFNCGSQNCAVSIGRYDSSSYCNYEDSGISTSASSSDAYLIVNRQFLAIRRCNVNTQGLFSFSYQYLCTEIGTVEERHYLNSDCSGDGYLINTYYGTNDNVNMSCPNSFSSQTSNAIKVSHKTCSDVGIPSNGYDPLDRYQGCEICPLTSVQYFAGSICAQYRPTSNEDDLGNQVASYMVKCQDSSDGTYVRTFTFTDDTCTQADSYSQQLITNECVTGSSPSITEISC